MVKNLLSDLSKLADGDLRNSHLIFSLVFLEEVVLVALVVVKVIVLLRVAETRLVAEYEIDPVVQLLAHEVGL